MNVVAPFDGSASADTDISEIFSDVALLDIVAC